MPPPPLCTARTVQHNAHLSAVHESIDKECFTVRTMAKEKRSRASDKDANGAPTKKPKSPSKEDSVGNGSAPPVLATPASSSWRRIFGYKTSSVDVSHTSSPEKGSNGGINSDTMSNTSTIQSRPPTLSELSQKVTTEKPPGKTSDGMKDTLKTTMSRSTKTATTTASAKGSTTNTTPSGTGTHTTTRSKQSTGFWRYTMLFWTAALLLCTNILTLGLWLETQMENDLTTSMLQKLESIPEMEEGLRMWQEFGRTVEAQRDLMEQQRNECGEQLKELTRLTDLECSDEYEGCPEWYISFRCVALLNRTLPDIHCQLTLFSCFTGPKIMNVTRILVSCSRTVARVAVSVLNFVLF